MRSLVVTVLNLTCFFALASSCWGHGLPKAAPLPQTVEQAQAIIVFKINSLDLKPKPVPKPFLIGALEVFVGSDSEIALSTFQGEGTYNLTAIKSIKGNVGAQLTINFPALSTLGYASVSRTPPFQAKVGDFLVALLRKQGDAWVAQDPWRPFVPLFVSPDLTAPTEGTPLQQVQALIVPQLKDEATRLMATDLLSNSSSPQITVALAPYVQDPNFWVRDLALSAMTRNQQLGAIALIRDLNRLGFHPRAITLLSNYAGIKEAVPLLNPLLFEDEYFIRVNTLAALSRSKDASSSPFLLLALYDAAHDKENEPDAYAMFAQISGAKLSLGAGDFNVNPDQARKEAWSWWQDELMGKHPVTEGESQDPAVSLRQSQNFETSDLAQLNLGLFMISETTRRAAARGLEKFAAASSIPYLLVALYDPQPDVALSAYTTLHRLIPGLGATSRTKWDKDRGGQTKVAFDWWQQHLEDADKPSTPPEPIKAPTVIAPTVR